MTTAFVLSGGGSLGAVQVGMLAALAERGFARLALMGPEPCSQVVSAPAAELGARCGVLRHSSERFDELARRSCVELRQEPAATAVERLAAIARRRRVTLLTATRDVDHSAATLLHQPLIHR